jgi:hypothetical protein
MAVSWISARGQSVFWAGEAARKFAYKLASAPFNIVAADPRVFRGIIFVFNV